MSRWNAEKALVLKTAQQMAEKGLVVGISGNVSLRLEGEPGKPLLAITPHHRPYESLSVEDIVVVDFEGETVEGELAPSAETMLHIGVYQARERVRAVIHTHSVYASIISVAGLEIPPLLDDQVTFLGGEIRLVPYALPGSEELAQAVIPALGERNAVLLANHGALGVGRDLREAFTACELVEKTAKVYAWSLALGKVHLLPLEAQEVLKAYFTLLQSGAE